MEDFGPKKNEKYYMRGEIPYHVHQIFWSYMSSEDSFIWCPGGEDARVSAATSAPHEKCMTNFYSIFRGGGLSEYWLCPNWWYTGRNFRIVRFDMHWAQYRCPRREIALCMWVVSRVMCTSVICIQYSGCTMFKPLSTPMEKVINFIITSFIENSELGFQV